MSNANYIDFLERVEEPKNYDVVYCFKGTLGIRRANYALLSSFVNETSMRVRYVLWVGLAGTLLTEDQFYAVPLALYELLLGVLENVKSDVRKTIITKLGL